MNYRLNRLIRLIVLVVVGFIVFAHTGDTFAQKSRGYLTTPTELATIKEKAEQNIEPYKSAVQQVLNYVISDSWPGGSPPSRVNNCMASRYPKYISDKASAFIYGNALAYHLTEDTSYADEVVKRIKGLLHISHIRPPGSCSLSFGRHIIDWIRAADLIEGYHGWTKQDKRRFQDWLAKMIAPLIWINAGRGNNIGAALTTGGQYIADYLYDRPDLRFPGKVRGHKGGKLPPTCSSNMTPAQAYNCMRELALYRMNGYIWDVCGEGVSMIRPDGGIPEELRRSTSCDAEIPTGAGLSYSNAYLSSLVAQAELCLRRGDTSIYENIAAEPRRTAGGKFLPGNRGSLKRAILFILETAGRMDKKDVTHVAGRYYKDPVMIKDALQGAPHGAKRSSKFNHFTTLTHGFAPGEKPMPPPIVAPPQETTNENTQSSKN